LGLNGGNGMLDTSAGMPPPAIVHGWGATKGVLV
jgi:hypothetical protein